MVTSIKIGMAPSTLSVEERTRFCFYSKLRSFEVSKRGRVFPNVELEPWKSVLVQPFRTWIPQYRLDMIYRMAHRASLVPYEYFWCIFQKNAPLGAQERGLVREGLCLTRFLDPKDAEYNPAVKDRNCDFKSRNYAPWDLLHSHRNAFMPLFQCFDLKSLR